MSDPDDKLNRILNWVITVAGTVMGIAWVLGWLARLLYPEQFQHFTDTYIK